MDVDKHEWNKDMRDETGNRERNVTGNKHEWNKASTNTTVVPRPGGGHFGAGGHHAVVRVVCT